jgi:hypothetical protein
MVSNVAVENVEWVVAGVFSQPHLFVGQEEAFRMFTIVSVVFLVVDTRANSRLVGKPSFGGYFPLARNPEVPGIDSHKPASVLVVNLPEQRFVFLRKWHRGFHRKWVCTNTTS